MLASQPHLNGGLGSTNSSTAANPNHSTNIKSLSNGKLYGGVSNTGTSSTSITGAASSQTLSSTNVNNSMMNSAQIEQQHNTSHNSSQSSSATTSTTTPIVAPNTVGASSSSTTTTTSSTIAAMDPAKKAIERENLRAIIAQWNANRLDLFEISEPNEDLEFYGVMRFYFQDAGQKVATKCMRISSTASTNDVIANLIEKFRPDIRMLSVPEYALYEIHENGDERKLVDGEMPLLVQLNWHKDDREGRFLLRRMDEKTYLPGLPKESYSTNSNALTGNGSSAGACATESATVLNRKLSKREKKEEKKKKKKEKAANGKGGKDSLAEKLYTELPETSFTRSISNPEAVMRRRRQQKLEKKLQQFSQEGGPEAGGTLRIFGEAINQDVPYKTILLSTRDTASFAVKEILDKYGKESEDPLQYCLVQVIVPFGMEPENVHQHANVHPDSQVREFILDDDDCPLLIERAHVRSRGVLTFHIRRRPTDYQSRKRKKKSSQFDSISNADTVSYGKGSSLDDSMSTLNGGGVGGGKIAIPFLLEVAPDGSELLGAPNRPNIPPPRRHYLNMNVTEVGSEVGLNSVPNRNVLQLIGPNILARHCVITHTEGIITITPCNRDAETYANGSRIFETTILKHGMLVRIGKIATFKFIDDAMLMRRMSQLSTIGTGQPQSLPHHLQQPQQQQQHPIPENGAPYETTFDQNGKIETSGNPTAQPHQFGSLQRQSKHPSGMVGGGGASMNGGGSLQRNGALPGTQSTTSVGANAQQPRKGDNILPAILEVWEEIEDHFLSLIIGQIDPNQVQFKLCITYTLYMVTRYRASTYFMPSILPDARANRLIKFCIKYSNIIFQRIKETFNNPALDSQAHLAFWLANSSELLHFLKNDRHLCAFTLDSQDILAEAIQFSFSCLVKCQQIELSESLAASFHADGTSGSAESEGVLSVLSNSMQLLRRFRVNAALTIQLFSQLFHFINMWLFNRVIGTQDQNSCTRLYGQRLGHCLRSIELWAENQGLELAAECHLSRISQTAQFLQAPKGSADELSQLCGGFFKLNSLQLRALFERYQAEGNEEVNFVSEQIEAIIKLARATTDELILKEGRELRLEEETDLQLPFLLPEDGYSCDIVCGIPAGLGDFVQSLVAARVCNLTIQATASGYWTIYFFNFQPDQTSGEQQQQPQHQPPQQLPLNGGEMDHMMGNKIPPGMSPMMMSKMNGTNTLGGKPTSAQPPFMAPQKMATLGKQPIPHMMYSAMTLPGTPGGAPITNQMPEVSVFKLQKSNNGLGLSIVAAQGVYQTQQGIYIKSVVKDGAAELDGRLEAGDQLLKVDGNSLIGIDQARAAELMTQTGPIVTLEVAKHGALYHGLAGLLNAQSASTSALMTKAANPIRQRFMPNVSQEYGSIRVPSMNHPRMPGPSYSPFNTLPVGMSAAAAYNQHQMMQQQQQQQQQQRMGAPTLGQAGQHQSMGSISGSQPSAGQLMRPDSQLSYSSTSKGNYNEERHYQNIQLYQLNPNARTASPAPGGQAPLSQNTQASKLHSSVSSLQQPQASLMGQSESGMNPSNAMRPVSALITSREQEQIFQNNGPFASPSTPTRTGMMAHSMSASGPEFFKFQPDIVQHQQQQQSSPQRQRDLARQEAKMEEIREELRRREQAGQQQPQSYLATMPRGVSMSNSALTPAMLKQNGAIGPGGRFMSQQALNTNGSTSTLMRQNGPPQIKQAPAPAPKPARPGSMGAANPQASQQQQQQQQQQHPQQQRNMGPSYPNSTLSKSSLPLSSTQNPSAWDRDEKEKENQHQKLEDSKRSRDEEIKYLESLAYRNPKTDDRLKALTLERDFQRRAEEHFENGGDYDDEQEDEDENLLDRADQRERILSVKQDIERTRQRRIEQRYGGQDAPNAGANRLSKTLEEQEERLKQLRLEEEAALQAEERIIQEAKKRQDMDDFSKAPVGKGILKSSSNYNGEGDMPPPLPNSSPPMANIESANQRLDRLLNATKNNAAGTSFDDSEPKRAGVLKNGGSVDTENGGKSVKKVSWNDNPATQVMMSSDDHHHHQHDDDEEVEEYEDDNQEDRFSLQDIDDVLGPQANTNKDWFAVSSNTPGVIGAQEIYNDPRKRIEAERQAKSNKNDSGSDKVPEKLSFKEKLTMFGIASTDPPAEGANNKAARGAAVQAPPTMAPTGKALNGDVMNGNMR